MNHLISLACDFGIPRPKRNIPFIKNDIYFLKVNMYTTGNIQKTPQEAKNKVIYNHKQLTIWCVFLDFSCVFSQLSFHFYVVKIIQYVSCFFPTHHECLTFQSPKAMSILVTRNTLYQLNLEDKSVIMPFWWQKFQKRQNWH